LATFDSMAMQRLAAATQGGAVETSATGSPVAVLFYLGTEDSGASFEVEAAGNMLFTTDGTTADTTVNATGTIDLSTPATADNTCLKIAAKINQSPNWEFILLGYRPEDGTDNLFAVFTETDVSTAAYKASGLFLYGDSAVTPYNTCHCISGFDPDVHVNKRSINPADPDVGCYSVLQTMEVMCDCSSAGTIYVYSANQANSKLLWTHSLTDATTTTFGTPGGFMFRSRDGDRIVVTIRNDQTGATDILRITGYTIDKANKYPRQGFCLTNALL